MTIPDATNTPLLLTDADVLARVQSLGGPACTDRQLWIMFVDGDNRQAPVLMPVSDMLRQPSGLLDGLAGVLHGVYGDLATDMGPGSVILTLERRGPAHTHPPDRAWTEALVRTCRSIDVGLRGVFLSSDTGVRRLV